MQRTTLDELYSKLGATRLSPGITNLSARIAAKRPTAPALAVFVMALALVHEMVIGADKVLTLARNACPAQFNGLANLHLVGVQAVGAELGMSREDIVELVKAGETAACEDLEAFYTANAPKLTIPSESTVKH